MEERNRSLSVRYMAAGALAAWLSVAGWQAFSSEQASLETTHRIPVALIDVSVVFKNYKQFGTQMAALKAEVELFDKDVKAKQASVASANGAAEGAAAATNETKEAQKKAAAMLAEAAAVVKRQEILQKETHIYVESYAVVEAAIAKVAKSRDIGVVLRYGREPVNPADRAAVLQHLNRPVVYSAVPDLTDEVTAILNEPKP